MRNSYSDPTVLWTLTRGAESAKAVFVPHAAQSTLVIFRNKQVNKIEDVKEWDAAISRADAERAVLLSQGFADIG